MSNIPERIVRVAQSKVGRRDWLYSVSKDNFGPNTNKCNQFVYDVMVEAGVMPPPYVPKYFFFRRPPTAGEWAKPSVEIEGWTVVVDPIEGDVIAEAHDYRDATGHVGIVVARKQSVSSNSLLGGVIVQNDWGFRSDNNPTFRRYTV